MIRRSSVMKLSNKSLRKSAAELDGWIQPKETEVPPYTYAHYFEDDEPIIVVDGLLGPMSIDDFAKTYLWRKEEDGRIAECRTDSPPDYPNDIGAAMDLWEKMPFDCCIENYTSTKGIPCAKICFHRDPGGVFEWTYSRAFDRTKEPLAKAITRTFIIAKEYHAKQRNAA